MNADMLQSLLAWVSLNPLWAGVAVFTISLTESLAVVGMAVPGVAMMFGVGALIGVGRLEFWSMAAWAVAGAIAGDGLSFWLGRHYRETLRGLWPFRSHPTLLARGEAFFKRYGGKSIVFGRFVGPVRAIVPLVAGMLDMAPGSFLVANVGSALAWGPAYLIPGMLFGASLELASEVAGRLAVLILVMLALLWFVLWLVRRLFNLLQPHAPSLLAGILRWGQGHPRLGHLSASLADPEHPEARGLMVLATLLLLAVWSFGATLAAVITHLPAPPWDLSTHQLFLGLRTPWADAIMVYITALADPEVLWPLSGVVLGWTLWQRNRAAAGHWAAAVAFCMLASPLIKYTLQIPRPGDGVLGLSPFSFPSGHTLQAGVLFGFLAVLVARELPAARRWIPYSAASSLVTGVAVSRIYLGAHWLSDVLASLSLALAWVSLLGIAYRSRPAPRLGATTFGALILLSFVGIAGLHAALHHERELARYLPEPGIQWLGEDDWWKAGWQDLPAYRNDLRGRRDHPLTLQWVGDLHAVRETLQTAGWREPVPLTAASTLLYLNPRQDLPTLPVLPHVHGGRHEGLLLIREQAAADSRLVLRLWNAHIRLRSSNTPLWLGNVSYQGLQRLGQWFTYPQTENGFDTALAVLRNDLRGVTDLCEVARPDIEPRAGWDGSVLLLR